MSWQFKREEQKFELLPEGIYRIRVKGAEKAVSRNGNDMLVLQFEVSGSNTTLYHYITFMDNKPEITNRMLTQFFDSFKDIPEGDFNMQNWIGKVGACRVKHEEYNGNTSAKLSYFIHADRQSELPPWKEPTGSNGSPKSDSAGFMEIGEEDAPF